MIGVILQYARAFASVDTLQINRISSVVSECADDCDAAIDGICEDDIIEIEMKKSFERLAHINLGWY
jgi:hypothetical protein